MHPIPTEVCRRRSRRRWWSFVLRDAQGVVCSHDPKRRRKEVLSTIGYTLDLPARYPSGRDSSFQDFGIVWFWQMDSRVDDVLYILVWTRLSDARMHWRSTHDVVKRRRIILNNVIMYDKKVSKIRYSGMSFMFCASEFSLTACVQLIVVRTRDLTKCQNVEFCCDISFHGSLWSHCDMGYTRMMMYDSVYYVIE